MPRKFYLFWSGELLSSLGNVAFTLAVPWYLAVHDPILLAVWGSAWFITNWAGIVVGPVGDYFNLKRVMISADLFRALLLVLALLLISLHLPISWMLVAVSFTVGVCHELFFASQWAMLPRLFDRQSESLAKANSWMGAMGDIASVAGVIGGALVLSRLGIDAVLALDAVTFCVSAAAIAVQSDVIGGESVGHTWRGFLSGWWPQTRHGVTTIFALTDLRSLVLVAAYLNVILGSPLELFVPLWVHHSLHQPIWAFSTWKVVVALAGIAGYAVMVPVRRRLTTGTTMITFLALQGLVIAALALFPLSLLWFLAMGALFGASGSLVNGIIATLFQEIVPEGSRATVFGTLSTLITGLQFLGPIWFGVVDGIVPLPALALVMGLGDTLGALALGAVQWRQRTGQIKPVA